MAFDPAIFEAEVALNLIPTERLPATAQDALGVGFDGPRVVRMSVLDPTDGWEIEQALPPMLAELGCHSLSQREAALRLAQDRARHILANGEDPLPSIEYFHWLMHVAGYPEELADLGYLDEDDILFGSVEEKRTRAREGLKELLSPELREKRRAERETAKEQAQARIKSEWPYVVNSPSGRALMKERYAARIAEMRPLLWIDVIAWGVIGWAFSSWLAAVIGYTVSIPVLFALPVWEVRQGMKRERREILLRRGVPEDQI
ncbi:MAG: hypothetical protein WBA18_06390 [Terracidiphilus sp.]